MVEWSAFFFGIIGSLFWATGYKWRGFQLEGYFWLVSSVLWVYFSIVEAHAGLMMRDLLSIAITGCGTVRSFLGTKQPT